MKRMILFLTVCCLLIGLSACGSSESAPAKPETSALETQTATASAESDPTDTEPVGSDPIETAPEPFEPIVLGENEACLVEAINVEHDEIWGLQVTLSCENKTENDLLFSLRECTINDYFVEPGWVTQVEPGQTKESEFHIFDAEAERCGLTQIDELRFLLTARDMDHYMDPPVLEEDVVLYPTGKTADEITFEPRQPLDTDHFVAGDERFSVIITGTEPDGFWGYTLYLYLENNTDQPVVFNWKDVKINGVECEPYWIYSLPAGMRGCTFLSIERNELEEKNIGDPHEFDFLLNVYNEQTYQDLYAEHCAVVFETP